MWKKTDAGGIADALKDLKEGDLIYFQKREGKMDMPWSLGVVEQVVRSERDQVIRNVIVKYQNFGEDFHRFTDRSVRKLVKLFDIDEFTIQEDLAILQKRIDDLQAEVDVDDQDEEAGQKEDVVLDQPKLPNDEIQDEISHVKASISLKVSRSRRLFFPCEIKFSNDSFKMSFDVEPKFNEEELTREIAGFTDVLFSHNLEF